jgi:peptidoglycan L-alanyl-D-glutamate endopeptidase CwlK
MFKLSKRSIDRMQGVHPALVCVVVRAIELTEVDFAVIEGVRSRERQAKLVAKGASTTMNSRHLTGHAVDLAAWVDGEIRWDWPLYYKIADAMKDAAEELDVQLTWGGDWRKFKDGPHFQLKWHFYP